MGASQEAPDGFAAGFGVIEGPMIDVHAHEFIREFLAHVASVSEGMVNGLRSMVETVADAGGEDGGDGPTQVRRETFVDDIAAQRQGQAWVLAPPPESEVLTDLQSFFLIGQLAFMD